MPIQRIAHSSTEIDVENYIGILRAGQSISDTGWSIYADSAGVNPIDGLGGSPSITWSQNSISPLSGEVDLRLVKDANNRQGNGVSIPFTVANRHLGKVLQISFDTELISGNYESPIITPTNGTYTITSTTVCTVTASHSFVAGQIVNMTFIGGTRPVDGFYTIVSVTATAFVITVSSGSATNATCSYTVPADLRVSIIQDPTGTPVVIEPVNTGIQLGVQNQRIRHIASFQTHISITSYRLCIHVSSASTVAYTVDFANFKVWEPTQSIGAIITDWQSYTPTLSGFVTSSQDFQWRRVGSDLQIQGRWVTSSGSAVEFRVPLPNGLVIDSLKIPSLRIVGIMGYSGAASTYFSSYATAEPNVSYITGSYQTSTIANLSKRNGNDWTAGIATFSIEASVPIAGWGSSVQMSSDSNEGRVVACNYSNSGNQGSLTSIIFSTRTFDTHNAYSTSTGVFTAPVQGIYRVSALAYSLSSQFFLVALKNGGNVGTLGGGFSGGWQYGSINISLNSGDTLGVAFDGTSSNGQLRSTISIERISAGSQVIASVEGVSASYYSAATQTSLTAQINFGTRVYDTHGAVTTGVGAWKFTAPMSGKYLVTYSLGASTTSSQYVEVWKNGLLERRTINGGGVHGSSSFQLNLLSSEYFDLRPYSSMTVSGSSNNDGNRSFIEITRIGN